MRMVPTEAPTIQQFVRKFFFVVQGQSTQFRFLVKTNLAQRNRCVANELLSLDGPDRKRYSIDFERGKLSNTGTIPEDNSIALTFRVANDMIFEIKFSFHHGNNGNDGFCVKF